MPYLPKKNNTLASNCLIPIVLLCVVGCASSPRKKAGFPPRQIRVKADILPLKKPSVAKEEGQLVGKLETRIAPLPLLKPTAPAEKRSSHPNPNPVKRPVKVLTPEEVGEGGDTDEEILNDLVGADEESISDSSQEGLHYYFRGYNLIKQSQWEAAISSLDHFLGENPTHVYADRAQYLVAEANCLSKEYHLCILAANTLESRYPYSLKIPEAHALKVEAFQGMGRFEEARSAQRLLSLHFPDHPVVKQLAEKIVPLKIVPPLMELKEEGGTNE